MTQVGLSWQTLPSAAFYLPGTPSPSCKLASVAVPVCRSVDCLDLPNIYIFHFIPILGLASWEQGQAGRISTEDGASKTPASEPREKFAAQIRQ